ncbi:MAG TPA: Flp pilus assembly complex ATPase component TadA [Dehalococcoidia bacterium]|nr:Flp pilus assembly complex ATPase component TadA [Dehalococcoidia bacterium]
MAIERLKSSTENMMHKPIGQLLLEEELITPEQLKEALQVQQEKGGKLGEILVKQGVVTAEDVAAVYGVQLNVPLVDLQKHVVQADSLRMIPEDMARKYTLIPLEVVNDSLTVVMAYPDDIRAIRDIRAQTGMRIEVALGVPSDIERAIDINYRSSGEIEKQVSQFSKPLDEEVDITSKVIAKTPIAQSLDLLIQQAVRDRASDVHLEPNEKNLRVRYRIDGILQEMFSLPLNAHVPLLSRIKILAEMNIAEQRRPQDGQFSVKVGSRDVDIRAATMATAYGERVTLRILDKSLSLFTLSELGFRSDTLKEYKALLKSPFGMILVGGPTGSGKTTTLYASINELDRDANNILTIEDPIEYRFPDISQTQVNFKAGITYASGLRAIVRHDPDVILVGEIRDKDTASTAVQAALTGHLVLASIHANDAISMVFRLMDLGIESYLITSTLAGLISQRMVRRICPYCRTTVEPTMDERVIYSAEMGNETPAFYRGTGCKLCANTGYRGRTGLFEMLVMNEEIRRAMLTKVSADDIKAEAIKQGMVTMQRDGMLKVKEGVTTASEVLRSVLSIS